jgi:hypothetical protein
MYCDVIDKQPTHETAEENFYFRQNSAPSRRVKLKEEGLEAFNICVILFQKARY